MAPQSLQTHSAAEKVGPNGRSSNEALKIVRDDQSPSIELSLGIDATSFRPLTSQNILPCGVQGAQVQTLMDPEPGRCRRTDGKKWRCRRDVLPDQKYCERHVHRGRQRSRKPVEVLKTGSESKPTRTNSNSSTKVLVKCPKTAKASRTSSTEVNVKNNGNDHIKNDSSARFTSLNPSNGNKPSSNVTKSSKASGNPGPSEFGFSPKSVLQQVQGCGTSSNHHSSTAVEAEPQRCRRTDGKKWRCSKDVLAEQKYCAQHMNRGAKKPKKIESNQKLKASLVISTASSHQRVVNDKNRSNGTSSRDSSSSSSDDENDLNGVIISSSSEEEDDAVCASRSRSSSSEATTISV